MPDHELQFHMMYLTHEISYVFVYIDDGVRLAPTNQTRLIIFFEVTFVSGTKTLKSPNYTYIHLHVLSRG